MALPSVTVVDLLTYSDRPTSLNQSDLHNIVLLACRECQYTLARIELLLDCDSCAATIRI